MHCHPCGTPSAGLRGTNLTSAPEQAAAQLDVIPPLLWADSHQVGMCGDGCNDCGALRTAHAGLSLSPAEPSAAAPFTSRSGTVAGVTELVREGRAALVASFALFKNVFSTGLVVMFLALVLYTVGGREGPVLTGTYQWRAGEGVIVKVCSWAAW